MKRVQPEYHLLKNTKYALQGFKDIIKNEKSFQLEFVIFLCLLPIIFFIDFTAIQKVLLFGSCICVLIIEVLNSAIERVVDLVTNEQMELAGQAKDAGSFAVMLTIVLTIVTWGLILSDRFL